MNELVSIIIPVYNTKKEYLDECIDSVLKQTYKKIEIILVDDGSNNKVARYLDFFPFKDRRVAVYHKENSGVSAARNYGLEKSKGTYISFIDSDDWVEINFIHRLVSLLVESKSDISVVGISKKNNVNNFTSKRDEVYFEDKMWEQLLINENINGYLANKLFKRDLIKQLLDCNLHYSEDFVFCAEYLKSAKKMIFCDNQLYHYRINNNNATSQIGYNDRIFTLLDAEKQLIEIYKQFAPNCLYIMKLNTLKVALNLRSRYKRDKINKCDQYIQIKEVISNYFFYCIFNKKIIFKEKINLVLTYLFPKSLIKVKTFALRRKKYNEN